MGIVDRAPLRRLVRPWLPALAAVAALVLVVTAPVMAATEGPTKLLDGSVSPRTGLTTTTVAFEVTYRNREGSEPDYVRVLIDGKAHAMAPMSGSTAYKTGVRFSYSTRLTVGRHAASFSAMDRDRFTASLSAGSLTISAPKTSTSGSGSTGSTSSGTTSGSGSGSGGSAAGSTTGSTGSADSGGTTSGASAESSTSPVSPGARADTLDTSGSPAGVSDSPLTGTARGLLADAGWPGSKDGTTEPDTRAAARVDAADGGGAGHGSLNASPAGLELLGLRGSPFEQAYRALPVMIATTGTVVVWAAFFSLGKRRREGDPPAADEVLAAEAAREMSPIPTAELVPPTTLSVDPNEAAMPRWRRPSLLAARKHDPIRNASVVVNQTFAQGVVGPVEGKECRQIRYRLVRLMDVPDELRASEIGILDQGDEVQLLEKSGTYWLVLCPDGQQGWLHQMVLGDVVVDEDNPFEPPEAFDEDILSAFLTSREKTA